MQDGGIPSDFLSAVSNAYLSATSKWSNKIFCFTFVFKRIYFYWNGRITERRLYREDLPFPGSLPNRNKQWPLSSYCLPRPLAGSCDRSGAGGTWASTYMGVMGLVSRGLANWAIIPAMTKYFNKYIFKSSTVYSILKCNSVEILWQFEEFQNMIRVIFPSKS